MELLPDEPPLAELPLDEPPLAELPVEPLPPDDDVDGDALPAVPVELLEPLALLLVCVSTPSACMVLSSRRPLPWMPCAFWKSRSAAWVFGPILPSTLPGSCPLSFSACCTAFTLSSPIAMLPPELLPLERIEPDFVPVSDFIVSDEDDGVAADEPAPVVELPADEPVEAPPDDFVALDDPLVSVPLEALLPDVPCANAGPAMSKAAAAAAVVVFHVIMC